jgi:hypothetical protein
MDKSSIISEGYNDWRSASLRLKEHENSSCHKTCVVKLMDRRNVIQRIDSKLMEQVNKEKIYWRSVLTRIVVIVKKLVSRGLPFRGHDEIIGSVIQCLLVCFYFSKLRYQQYKQYCSKMRKFQKK